jgi:hypothetical protein
MRGWTATTSTMFLVGAAACGGAQRDAGRESAQGFTCNDRMAGYVGHGTLAADEIGVAIDCAARGPRLLRWRVESDGTRAEDERGLSPGEFDTLWRKIDDTGWRDLQGCDGGAEHDPVYTFSFKDWTGAASFECRSADPPFPYHTILDELDRLALSGRGQLGPDVPAPDETAAKKMKGAR